MNCTHQFSQSSDTGIAVIRRNPRHFFSTPDSRHTPDIDDKEEILGALMGGMGVAECDWEGLVIRCDSCQFFFLSSVLESHTASCSYSEDS
jgi:hypothetical protein